MLLSSSRSEIGRRGVIAFTAALSVLFAVTPASAQWKPDRPIELIVGSAAGGGNDKSARVMQKIFKDTGLGELNVINRVGGGGAVAYTYVSQKSGEGSSIALAQAGLNTNHITGRSPLHYTDMTPLAFVGNEPVGLAVRADSPHKTLKDLIAQLKKDPQSLSISTGSTRGATNHFALALLAKEAGIDPNKLKIVVFGGGAEAVTNLLGGHIDAFAVAINNSIQHHKAGTLRVLAISSQKRSDDLPNVSTFKEQGFNVVMEGWTVFMGPKNMSPAQVTYYEQAFAKATNNPQWKQYLDQNSWEWGYKNAKDTAAYLKQDYDVSKRLLTELGLAAK